MQRALFFNATPTDDRVYYAQDFADYFAATHSNGLLHPYGQPGLKVSLTSGMGVSVDPGYATIRGHYYENTTPHEMMLDLPDVTYNRIDRIVLRWDSTHNVRDIFLHVKRGTPAQSPQAPALTRNNDIYELSLAQIFVRANTVQLNASDLTDERLDKTVCGKAVLKLEIPDEQIEDVMDAWFADEDKAMFLQRSDVGVTGGVAPFNDFNNLRNEFNTVKNNYIPKSEKGASNGVATLVSGRIPNRQLGYYSPSNSVIMTLNDYDSPNTNRDTWYQLLSLTLPVTGRIRLSGVIYAPSDSWPSDNVQLEIRDTYGNTISPTIAINRVNYSPNRTPFNIDISENVFIGAELTLMLRQGTTGNNRQSFSLRDLIVGGAI